MVAHKEGKNVLSVNQNRKRLCEQQVPHTFREPGAAVHYGDAIQLKGSHSGLYCANDVVRYSYTDSAVNFCLKLRNRDWFIA